jgi:hypothetical protein
MTFNLRNGNNYISSNNDPLFIYMLNSTDEG